MLVKFAASDPFMLRGKENRLVKKSIDPEVTTLLRYFINDVK